MTSKLKYPDGIPFTEVRLLNVEDCFIKDLSATLKPEQGFVYFKFYFKDGTSATFKDAGSLQEFLDRLAKFHELEQQLIQAKKDLEILKVALNSAKQTLFFCWDVHDSHAAKCTAEDIDKALEQIEHKG